MSRRARLNISFAARGFAAMLCLAFFSGCFHWSEAQTPPPDVDLSTPPVEIDEPERIQPRQSPDYWTFGAFVRPQWEIGRVGGEDERQRNRRWGAEAVVAAAPLEIPFPLVGLGGGCAPCTSDHPEGRRYYSEFHTSALFVRFSGGWTFQPSAGHHGPQITMGWPDFFHFRWYKLSGQRHSFLFGMSLPVAGFFYSRPR